MDDMKKKETEESVQNAAIAGGATEVIQRYGSAVKEHIAAYSGLDNENARQMNRGLRDIAEYSINPRYQKQNYRQQAGFSAEIKEVANTNAENIINKSNIRKIRTDDLGRVNDPLYDFKEIDKKGNVISDSGIQMKFIGNSPQECLCKLESKKYEKYLNNNARFEVPSDYYEGIHAELDKKIVSIQKQLEKQSNAGNTYQLEQLEERLNKYQKIKQSLKKSSVSNKEAMFARKFPRASTVKSVVGVSHRAGIESAKGGVVIGGSVSIIKNFASFMKGEEEAEDAIVNVARDTAESAVIGYGTGFAGSVMKGAMQNAKSESMRILSKTNLPGMAVAATLNIGKVMGRYFSGDINGVECLEELGEQGTEMLSSSLFATIGQIAIPIPVVGGVIGGMIGYAVASASYGILMSALKEAKVAHEERIQIERECEEQIKLIQEYRSELEKIINEYLVSNMAVFHQAFDEIKLSLAIGDVDGFISGANAITEKAGRKPLFSNFNEFEQLMESDFAIKL